MAQFEPFAENVEVNGETVLATVNSFPKFMKKIALEMLEESGIVDPQPGKWYSQKAWLDSFREIDEKYGSITLFEIGRAIPENAKFPSKMNSIEEALNAIDTAYHMNHRNGEIGFYKLVSHDKARKTLIMQCKNPYPCDFDRGIITALARKFEVNVKVFLDTAKPSRKDGADESWYIITYS